MDLDNLNRRLAIVESTANTVTNELIPRLTVIEAHTSPRIDMIEQETRQSNYQISKEIHRVEMDTEEMFRLYSELKEEIEYITEEFKEFDSRLAKLEEFLL